MGLFRRKTTVEDEGDRCPRCTERVPEGAGECAMCGLDLRPLRALAVGPKVEAARPAIAISGVRVGTGPACP